MGRALFAMLCIALCSALLGSASAGNQETGIRRLLLRAAASRSFKAANGPGPCGGAGQPVCAGDQLNGREFECDYGFVGVAGICKPFTPAATPQSQVSSGPCGANGQPVCSGTQLQGRPFECDFGFSGMNGVCVPYVEKNKADLASPPPPPPPVAPAPPPPTPAAQSNLLEDNIGLESRGCADPIVQGLIALDNEARAAIGSPQLTCDENVCRLALEHSKSQCLSMDHDMLTLGEGPGSRGAQMSAMGMKSRAENAFWNPSHLNEQVVISHDGLMGSCYHKNNLEDPAFNVVGYGYYVCAEGPIMREQVDGTFTPYEPPISFPVMYHTATFGGPQRTVPAKTTCS